MQTKAEKCVYQKYVRLSDCAAVSSNWNTPKGKIHSKGEKSRAEMKEAAAAVSHDSMIRALSFPDASKVEKLGHTFFLYSLCPEFPNIQKGENV